MKRRIIAVTFLLAVLGLGASWAGAALERGWKISSFDVEAFFAVLPEARGGLLAGPSEPRRRPRRASGP